VISAWLPFADGVSTLEQMIKPPAPWKRECSIERQSKGFESFPRAFDGARARSRFNHGPALQKATLASQPLTLPGI